MTAYRCVCGCEWHGQSAVDNPVIDCHRNRRRDEPRYWVKYQCAVSEFKCACPRCEKYLVRQERLRQRLAAAATKEQTQCESTKLPAPAMK